MVRRYKDVEAMKESLRKEMIRLGLQKNASKTEYNKRYNKEIAPSPSGVLGRTNMKWQELMAEFGFAKKQKSGSKQYGVTRPRRKWDAAEKNELTLQVVDLIHKYKKIVCTNIVNKSWTLHITLCKDMVFRGIR